jgi:hypothetical protein
LRCKRDRKSRKQKADTRTHARLRFSGSDYRRGIKPGAIASMLN